MDMQSFVYLIAFFIVYSFLGWTLESVTKTISQKKFVNSGFLFGPFCPIYGSGAVAMILILNSYQGNYITIFILSFFIFSVWEYFVGWLLEKIFHTKYWDYSYYKFQIKGRVCLVNSLTWGVLGVAFVEIIHPVIAYLIYKIPVNFVNWTTAVLAVYMAIDFSITVIKIKNVDVKLTKLGTVTNSIKAKIEELKLIPEKARNNQKLQDAMEELKVRQAELKETLEEQTKRFKRAFPRMKSEKIREFLNKKIEIKKIKKE